MTYSHVTSCQHIRKFESQYVRHITVIEAKEQHRRQCEANANRIGTDRTKTVEALAQTSQLLNGVELPFNSS